MAIGQVFKEKQFHKSMAKENKYTGIGEIWKLPEDVYPLLLQLLAEQIKMFCAKIFGEP